MGSGLEYVKPTHHASRSLMTRAASRQGPANTSSLTALPFPQIRDTKTALSSGVKSSPYGHVSSNTSLGFRTTGFASQNISTMSMAGIADMIDRNSEAKYRAEFIQTSWTNA